MYDDMDDELIGLMDEFRKGWDEGYGTDYIEALPEPQRNKLMAFLCKEVEAELRKDLN